MTGVGARSCAGLLILLLAAACSQGKPEPSPSSPSAVAWGTPSAIPRSELENPFGVMLPSAVLRSPTGLEVLKSLGVVYYRPASIFLDRWDGTCVECDIALAAGLQLILTVRNTGPPPTAPPEDLAAYRQSLAEVLERYRPSLLVVENEENSALFYTGTPEQYAMQLEAACEEAHRRGIRCTNGGLVGTLVALLVYDRYLQLGEAASAEEFARRVLSPEVRRQLGSPQARDQVEKGKALLASYRSAGADYVNFHWYFADPTALEEAVHLLAESTGLPVITNEIGQLTDDPLQTTAVMATVVKLALPVAVWFGLDGPQARGLVDSNGNLRPTGEAFRRFIDEHFGPR